jgi:hypothetical protein
MNLTSLNDKLNYLTSFSPILKYKEMYDSKNDLFYTAWVLQIQINDFEEIFWDRELETVVDVTVDFINTHKMEN